MRILMAEALLVGFFLVTPNAQAASWDAKERAAKKACLTGKTERGVELLTDLYIKTNDPNHIFNQGRCFEQNNRYEDAIGRFREYLRKAGNASAEDRADAEKHIAECRVVLGEKNAPEPAPAPKADAPPPKEVVPAPATVVASPAPVLQPEAVPPAALPPAQVAAASVAPPPPPPVTDSGRGLRIAGIACGAVGVASLGAGIYFYTRARSYSDKVSGTRSPTAADQDAGRTAETMQWVFYGVAGATIATGTVLYLFGWHSAETNSTQASIAPMLAPGIAGISAQGAF